MNANADARAEREDIEMLLPWYVTGRLDPSDADRVEAYLLRHPEMQRQLDLIAEEQDETVRANEAISGPSPGSVDRLLAQVAGSQRQESHRGLMNRLGDWLRGSGGLSWAAAAAACLILLQATVIALLVVRQETGGFSTASGPGEVVAPGSYAVVRFAADATAAEIATTLADLDMTIADGPRAGGLFSVRIGPEEMSPDERRARAAALAEQADVVDFATAAP